MQLIKRDRPRLDSLAFEDSRGNPQILHEPKEAMKRILRLAVSAMMLLATVMGAQNSQTFYLATAARAGKVQRPRGICEVTWSALSGSRVGRKETARNEEEAHESDQMFESHCV